MKYSTASYLAHFGILGQKWGTRRWQNPDGSLTPEGRARYYSPSDLKGNKKAQRDFGNLITGNYGSPERKAAEDTTNKMADEVKNNSNFKAYQQENQRINDNFKSAIDKLSDKQKSAIIKKAADKIEQSYDFMEDGDERWMYWDDPILGSSLYDSLPESIKKKFDTKKYNDNIKSIRRLAESYTKDILSDVYDDELYSLSTKNNTVGKRVVEDILFTIDLHTDLGMQEIELDNFDEKHDFALKMMGDHGGMTERLDDELRRRKIYQYD